MEGLLRSACESRIIPTNGAEMFFRISSVLRNFRASLGRTLIRYRILEDAPRRSITRFDYRVPNVQLCATRALPGSSMVGWALRRFVAF